MSACARLGGRGNSQQAETTCVAHTVSDARASREIATAERGGLKFTPADEDAVKAAIKAADAATKEKDIECVVRGPKCQIKTAAEAQALADVKAAAENRAMTDRAAKLDTQIAEFRGQIAQAGPVRETNSQGKVLARLLGLDEAEAARMATRQNAAMMVVAELLLVVFLVAAEELGKYEAAQSPERPQGRPEDDGKQEGAHSGQVAGHLRAPLQNQGVDADIIQFKPRGVSAGAEGDGQVGTPTEQVWALAAKGLSQVAIAKQLGIGRATVQRYLKKAAAADA